MLTRAALAGRVMRGAVAVFVCALLAYGTALGGDYVFDDLHSVSDNKALHDLGNLARFWVDPSTFSVGSGQMYRPALLTSFALNWAVSGAAWSLKAGNVLLHATVAVLVFGWLWRLSRRLRASAVVALGFAAHPLASEAVNMISSRSELLTTFGMLLALHAQLSWQRGWRPALAALGMVLGGVVACGSKETGAVLPFVAAAQALWLRQGGGTVAWRRSLAGLLPLVAVVCVYLVVRKQLLGEATVNLLDRAGGDVLSGHGRTLGEQLATMGTVLPVALSQMVVPWRLSLDPPVTFHTSFAEPAVAGGWLLLAVLTGLALRPGPRARLRRIGVALAWGVALPWIVVPLNMPFAEHRLYGPLVGVAAIAVAAVPRLRVRRAVAAVAVAATVALAIGVSAARSWCFRDETELWRTEVARNPESARAWWGLGACLLRAQHVPAAADALLRAHALNPRHFDTLRNCVEALVSMPDELADATRSLEYADRLAALSPKDPWARTLQAQAHLQAGRTGKGREHFPAAEQLALSCLQIASPKGYVYQLAARARRGLGDDAGALGHLDTAIARGLHPAALRLERAALLRELGRAREAQIELLTAQREAPGDPAVLQALFAAAAPAK